MASRIGEKVPGWVERFLIPTIETRVRSIVKEEFYHFEKVFDARLSAQDERFTTRIDALDAKIDAKIDSLEKRFPVVQDLAEIKARLTQVEKNQR